MEEIQEVQNRWWTHVFEPVEELKESIHQEVFVTERDDYYNKNSKNIANKTVAVLGRLI
ncbi:hypothetical protein ACG8BF_14895 (plasmid) [Enterococcus faecalis]